MGQNTKRVKFRDLDEIFGKSGKGVLVSSDREIKKRVYL